jgi:ankyrin repeat protein
LYYAAVCGFGSLAKHLIITHALDVNAKVLGNWTPLFAASRQGHVDVARVLLDYGADINARDLIDTTPLYWSSRVGHLKVVQLLLEHGANSNVK